MGIDGPCAQGLESFQFAQLLRLAQHLGRNPLRKCRIAIDMVTRGSVFLARLRKLARRETIRGANQGGPQPPMHEGDLAADQAAYQDVA